MQGIVVGEKRLSAASARASTFLLSLPIFKYSLIYLTFFAASFTASIIFT